MSAAPAGFSTTGTLSDQPRYELVPARFVSKSGASFWNVRIRTALGDKTPPIETEEVKK